jgi:hypothetical protein
MARVSITKFTPLGTAPTLQPTAGSMTLTETAADATNKQSVAFGNYSKVSIIAHNTGAGARTVTVTSVADGQNRTGDITAYSIAAGGIAYLGPFERPGWAQTDATLYFEASHAEVLFSVVPIS